MTTKASFSLPLVFPGSDLRVLLVGGGSIAYQKYRLLHSSGASIEVVAKKFSNDFESQLVDDGTRFHSSAYQPEHLDNVNIVIAATSSRQTNEVIATDARKRSILVNCVDQPELCDFIVPALLRRGPLLLAITSMGTAPAVSAWMRRKIEQWLPHSWSDALCSIGHAREEIKRAYPDINRRRDYYDYLLSEMENGRQEAISSDYQKKARTGKVWIVGAGPGDSQLLTLSAAKVLGQADVVLYDSLLGKDIFDYVRREAQLIHVGCRAQQKDQSGRQDSIHRLLVSYAKKGLNVVRLKGGDPSIFARAGEEIEQLEKASIEYQIIPGISAFQAASASLGVSLTHRNLSSQVSCMSGHNLERKSPIWWQQFFNTDCTWAIYMATGKLSFLVTKLSQMGVSPKLRFAIIEKASLPEQVTRVTTVSQLYKDIENNCLKAIQTPSLILIGSVLKQAQQSAQQATKHEQPMELDRSEELMQLPMAASQ